MIRRVRYAASEYPGIAGPGPVRAKFPQGGPDSIFSVQDGPPSAAPQ